MNSSTLAIFFYLLPISLYAQEPADVQKSEQVEIKLHTVDECDNTKSRIQVRFGIPIIKGKLFDPDMLTILVGNEEIPASVEKTTEWLNILDNSKNNGIRSVVIHILIDKKLNSKTNYKLVFNKRRTKNYNIIKSDGICQYLPELSATYLAKTGIRSNIIPVNTTPNFDWFDKAYIEYAKTAVNDVGATVKYESLVKHTTDSDPWLYDRAMTLFGLYFRTGDIKWLQHAHQAAHFYAKHINARGYFTLNTKAGDDLKYSYGQPLLADYMFTGDATLVEKIESVARAGLAWNPIYTLNTGFWTERHQAYALLAALSAWELTGKEVYSQRVNAIVIATLHHQANPPGGWQADGSLLHTVAAHEGNNNQKPVGSPWMSALLSEAIWRYYLHSDDAKVLPFFANLGDWVVSHGLYEGVHDRADGPTLRVSWYLASRYYQFSDGGVASDLEHGCDVAGLLARAVWAKQQLRQDVTLTMKAMKDSMQTCRYALNLWHRPGSDVKQGLAVWRLNPPRKFNWWFGTTLDLPWFYTELGI